jgi:hypothetical protein
MLPQKSFACENMSLAQIWGKLAKYLPQLFARSLFFGKGASITVKYRLKNI